jgi:hypothetical protein
MKIKIVRAFYLSLIVVLVFLYSCSKDDNKQTTTTQTKIENSISSGTWSITYFFDSGTNETNNFSGYSFTFNTNGTLTSTNGTNTYNGNWNISDSNSDIDSVDDLHFNITFNVSNHFEDLNDDWNISSQSSTKLELFDVSGGGGGTDYLTFEKN